MRAIKKSVLLRTSSGADVWNSGGYLNITGLTPVNKKDITGLKQVKYRAEVPQVVTVAGTNYTPAASTTYKVLIGDSNRTQDGYNEGLKPYAYTTPATLTDIGATAALQREYIHGQIVTRINNDPSNHVVAASVGSGNGFTVTDDGSYYPPRSQSSTNVKGPSVVKPVTNPDGSGFSADNVSVTTAAVYSVGVGSVLAALAPSVDAMYGNLISGEIEAPPLTTTGLPAVANQQYDLFAISSLKAVSAHQVSGQLAYQPQAQTCWVDNGLGTDTTNAAGFLTFQRMFRKNVAYVYSNDTNALIDFFDSPTIFQGPAGAVPATTGENKVATSYGQFVYNNIGTNTITVPTPGNTGLLLDQDLTDTEGAEYTPSLLTNNSQSFIVGKTGYSITARVAATDHTDAGFMVGFHIKAAHAADFNNYTDLGAIGFLADDVYTWGILNNAATVATDTTLTPTDGSFAEYTIKVAANGTVTAFYNGASQPIYSTGTTTLVLDAGDEIIPFFRSVNAGGGDPDVVISEVIAVADTEWLN